MPVELAADFADRLLESGGRSPKRAIVALRLALARIDVEKTAGTDRRELVKSIVEIQGRLNDLMRWATG